LRISPFLTYPLMSPCSQVPYVVHVTRYPTVVPKTKPNIKYILSLSPCLAPTLRWGSPFHLTHKSRLEDHFKKPQNQLHLGCNHYHTIHNITSISCLAPNFTLGVLPFIFPTTAVGIKKLQKSNSPFLLQYLSAKCRYAPTKRSSK
jgi:hypothetical protein